MQSQKGEGMGRMAQCLPPKQASAAKIYIIWFLNSLRKTALTHPTF